jgi:biotin-(acetyl-CoA carboxylase) ligase
VVLMRGALPLIRGAGQQRRLRYTEIEPQVRVREPKMPLNSRSRVRAPFAAGLDLPPPFRAIALREVGDAFAHATKIAAESGAGTLVYVGRFDLIEFAVVLEPEEPLHTARRALYAGLSALADALAAHAPPEKPINFDWPDAIRVDGGRVGGARLAWPTDAQEDAPPLWLVFGATVRAATIGEPEAGLHRSATALDVEGFDLGSRGLLQGFARHLMVAVDAWEQEGFTQVARRYLSRLRPETDTRSAIDDNGDLLMRRAGKPLERRPLVPALAAPSWLDPTTGEPRL